MEKNKLCPCGSQSLYSDCCEPIIEGKQHAKTAEALMRSRYTAYTKGKVDHVVNTTHPSHRESSDREAIQSWAERADWHSLEIVNSEEEENQGRVEFIATYSEEGVEKKHHEMSTFKKEGDEWFYDNGRLMAAKVHKAGRNDPCPCGSGKKYKKCCG